MGCGVGAIFFEAQSNGLLNRIKMSHGRSGFRRRWENSENLKNFLT